MKIIFLKSYLIVDYYRNALTVLEEKNTMLKHLIAEESLGDQNMVFGHIAFSGNFYF